MPYRRTLGYQIGDGLVSLSRFNVPLDGTTDATAKLVAALASGETLYHPGGTALVSPDALELNANQHIFGAGRKKAIIKRASAGTLLKINGTATGNPGHKKYCGLHEIQLHGNDLAGTLLEMYYTGDHVIEGCDLVAAVGRGIDMVECWDTRIWRNTMEWTGDYDTDAPCIHIRNAAAASGWGSGNDNSNQIDIRGNRVEAFRNRGLVIERGVGSQDPNGFYLFGNKFETMELMGPRNIIDVRDGVVHIVVDGLYVYAKMGAGSAAGPVPELIKWTPGRAASLRNVLIATGTGFTQTNGVTCYGSAAVNEVSNIDGNYAAAPVTAHVYYAGGPSFSRPVPNRTNLGTVESFAQGNVTAFPEGRPGLVGTVTGAYTLRFVDTNSRIDSTSASDYALTVPPNSSVAFPWQTRVEVFQHGAGIATITPGAGVTLRGPTLTTTQYQRLVLTKRATDEWYVTT